MHTRFEKESFVTNILETQLKIRKKINRLAQKRDKGRSRRCNFTPWDKGQCPHGALFHAVPLCCKCFQQCQIAGIARVGTLVSYPTLLEALATPWESVEQCSMGTLSWRILLQASSSWQLGADFLNRYFNGNIYFTKNWRLYHVYKSCLDKSILFYYKLMPICGK